MHEHLEVVEQLADLLGGPGLRLVLGRHPDLRSAGASAALAGLVIVAISVNLHPILKYDWLPSRAGSTVATLLLLLAIALAGLIPGQSLAVLGGELVVLSVIGWLPAVLATTARLKRRLDRPAREQVFEASLLLLTPALVTVAGVLLLTSTTGGLYVTAAATITGYVVGVLNAWVLLVEILR